MLHEATESLMFNLLASFRSIRVRKAQEGGGQQRAGKAAGSEGESYRGQVEKARSKWLLKTE